jgi:hypothetical protein
MTDRAELGAVLPSVTLPVLSVNPEFRMAISSSGSDIQERCDPFCLPQMNSSDFGFLQRNEIFGLLKDHCLCRSKTLNY